MGKVFGILLIVVGIWVGLTVYTEGVDRAYGGLFVRFGLAAATAPSPEEARSPAQRIGDRVGSHYGDHEARTHRLADDD